ncbi:MAG TPA: hypothetical protein PLN31_16180 [Azoarcus taiwanensis]|nr:hypothetical protein [Azoarcus taiwanensis]
MALTWSFFAAMLSSVLRRLGPVWSAALLSVPLSLIAITGNIAPNRDGMLYVQTAQRFLSEGLEGASRYFDWIVYPILIALTSRLTGLPMEPAAYFWSIFLMAVVCGLAVRVTLEVFPRAGWAACLVVLALPAFNGYRDFVIREFGAWTGSLLACWYWTRWQREPDWPKLFAGYSALLLAFSFRPEVIAFVPGVLVWVWISAPRQERTARLLWASLPALGVVFALAALFAFGGDGFRGRLMVQASSLNLMERWEAFETLSASMADSVLNSHSADDASMILLFGLSSVIFVKYLINLGVFVVPLGYALWTIPTRKLMAGWGVMAWIFVMYLLVLIAFMIKMQFVTTRYVSFLHVLSVPLVACGLAAMFERWPNWRKPIVVLGIVLAVSNVISLGEPRTQFRDAGEWLGKGFSGFERIYLEDARIAYFAGWSFLEGRRQETDRGRLVTRIEQGRYDVLALTEPVDDAQVAWLMMHGFSELVRFENRRGERVTVFVNPGAQLRSGGVE